jgi:pectate lyase
MPTFAPWLVVLTLATAVCADPKPVAADNDSPEPTLAFPGAEGAGRFATGGRGGEVVHVTNLKATGPGSLADAVSKPNRIVVFDVSGIIDLTVNKNDKVSGGRLEVDQPNITIAGQTAPGEGICLKGGMLVISSSNVIVRHIRSRRGWVCDQDTGDAIVVEPTSEGEKTEATGLSQEQFDKIVEKKAERGKVRHAFAAERDVIIDHCSTSWATDENLTVTHTDRTTVGWCIAAEGLDYANAKQTPPNHSEGSLWGSSAADGRATLHHTLYAHNRLRNPRTTGGADVPAVLNFYNNVVYNWSEYASHTGSERVLLNWLNNYYKPGRDTPAEIASTMFQFQGDPASRIFASGNRIEGTPKATDDNKLAIAYGNKFKHASTAERAAMIVDKPFADAPKETTKAKRAFEDVLDEAGATLPARDAVDLRIITSARDGTGRIIERETDLDRRDRWPDYHSLPAPNDRDGDGMPDFWERQFKLDPRDPADGRAIAASGYTNVEHYLNNTDPAGRARPIVFVSATISRARSDQPGEWRVTRTGGLGQALTVKYEISGDAKSGKDFVPLSGEVVFPSGQASAAIALNLGPKTHDDRTVVISLSTEQPDYRVGCPAQSLVVIDD